MSDDQQRARARSRRKRGRGRGPKRGDQPPNGAPSADGAAGRPRDKRNRKRGGDKPGGQPARRPQREQAPGRTDQAGFWGDPELLPAMQRDVRITDAPAAVPRSLGSPPLPGHEAVAEHYFRVVYERAVGTAGALAAAGGLIDLQAVVDDD
jgi:hypothetical protein